MQGQVQIQEADSRVQWVHRRRELRQQVLEGDLDGQAAEREEERVRLRTELEVLERAWEGAAMQLQEVGDQVGRGMLQESQLQGAQLHLLQIETRMEILRMKLEAFEEESQTRGQ